MIYETVNYMRADGVSHTNRRRRRDVNSAIHARMQMKRQTRTLMFRIVVIMSGEKRRIVIDAKSIISKQISRYRRIGNNARQM